MKTRNLVGLIGLGVVVGLSLGLAPRQDSKMKAEQKPAAEAKSGSVNFNVDSVHSSVVFKISHMGVSNFYGTFNELSGSYSLNEADPSKSQFDFQVKVDSVNSRNSKRDGHLKSPDFFNVAEFPTIAFKSTKVERTGEKQLKVTGNLSMHGETKPITVDMNIFTAKQTQQGYKGGLEATFTIKRTDFGMDTYVAEGGLGDEVSLTVALEAARSE